MQQGVSTPASVPSKRRRGRAIVACADPEIRRLLLSVVGKFNLQPVCSDSLDEAKALMKQQDTAMVFSQPRFREGGFKDVLTAASRAEAKVPVIVCSEFYDRDLYIEAMSLGAFDYLAFPIRQEQVEWIISNAVKSRAGGAPEVRH